MGELSADLAGRTRHRGRLRYVAPGLHDWTLNPIEGDFAHPTQQDAAVGNILKLFERMGFGNLAVLTNVREWAINALYLSFALPRATLSDVKRLLTDEDFRRPLYRWPHLNADVRDEWRAFDTLKPKGQQDLVGPLLGRLNTITKPAIFRRLMGNDGTPVALRRWLDAGDLVIIDVTQGLQGRTATTVANLVLAVLLGLTFARPPQSPHAWRIVCDEFHTFCDGEQVEELISQGRKRTVYPILSNQFLRQLDDTTATAVKDCPIGFFLRCASDDEGALRRKLGVGGIAALPRYRAVVTLDQEPLGTLLLRPWWNERDEGFFAALTAPWPPRIEVEDGPHAQPEDPPAHDPEPPPAEPHPPLAACPARARPVPGADLVAAGAAALPPRTKSKTGAPPPRRRATGG